MGKICFEDLNGKIMLVGLTYYSKDGEFIERKQIWGKVVRSDEVCVKIEQSNGEIYELPPDLSSVKRAAPGIYTLRSTNETVTDPDFLSTWNVTRPQ